MNRATPIPDSIERRPGGMEHANCAYDGRRIVRSAPDGERPLHWWHTETMLARCAEGK